MMIISSLFSHLWNEFMVMVSSKSVPHQNPSVYGSRETVVTTGNSISHFVFYKEYLYRYRDTRRSFPLISLPLFCLRLMWNLGGVHHMPAHLCSLAWITSRQPKTPFAVASLLWPPLSYCYSKVCDLMIMPSASMQVLAKTILKKK